jgi:putative redox protein
MQGRVEWAGGSKMVGTNSNGQSIEMDWDDGPSPMQLTLQMIGACSLVDVVIGLKDRNFSAVWVEINSTRREESPRSFTSIEMEYHITGEVPKLLAERIIHKSHEKYCSVSNSLNPSIKINCTVIINGVHK